MLAVHGDDFTTLGLDEDTDLQESSQIKIRGRLGEGCPWPQEKWIINRAASVNEPGLSHQADPRHCDYLMNSLTLHRHSSLLIIQILMLSLHQCLSEPCNAISNDSHSQLQNIWLSLGEHQVWPLLHSSNRHQLETPCEIPDGPQLGSLSAMRPDTWCI